MSLPLSSMEGYVFSRLDGILTVEELCAAVSLEQEELSRIINKLVELEAVDILELSADEESDEAAAAGQGEVPGTEPPRPEKARTSADEGGDLSLEIRQLLNQMKLRMENANYYQLLGVEPTAERAAIRSAYFDLSKKLHPDAYYGKNLGKYRLLMEEVFAKVTEAYETLSRKKRRAKYDEYIIDQIRAWEMERSLSGEAVESPQAPMPPPPSPPPRQPPSPPRGPAPPPQRPAPTIGQESEMHRRLRQQRGQQALMKLISMKPRAAAPGGTESVAKSVTSGIDIPEPPPGASAQHVLAFRYAKAGLEALELKDLNSAMNFLQLALNLAPHDEHIQEAEEKVRTKAQGALSSTYERQGRYEEEAGHYLQAAVSFSKALDIKGDDHRLSHRIALNLLRGDGDHDKGRELARQAVKAQPDSVQYRLTLAEIYLKKGWENDARRELDTALQLDPQNERAARLLRAIGHER